MARLKATTYAELDRLLSKSDSCKIGHNTVARRDQRAISIDLHGHTIVTLYSHGEFIITLAGYPTVTTRERINQFLPDGIRVFQKNHQQFIGGGSYETTWEISAFGSYGLIHSMTPWDGKSWLLTSESSVYGCPLS